jgi:hypothetical protein
MYVTVNIQAIRNQINRSSDGLRANQYWISDPKCSNLLYDLKPHSFIAIYQKRYDLSLYEGVMTLPSVARIFHKYSVNAYCSYNTWAIAYDHADRLLQELRERQVNVAYLLFYDAQGKFAGYSEDFAELLIKYWEFA